MWGKNFCGQDLLLDKLLGWDKLRQAVEFNIQLLKFKSSPMGERRRATFKAQGLVWGWDGAGIGGCGEVLDFP